MKRISDRARKRYREAKPIRDSLRELGYCEICGSDWPPLDVHEICRGVHRQAALDKLYCLLLVCRRCHEDLGSASEWPEARQLAIFAESRLFDFNLKAYLELTSPRAPRRIELWEVMQYMSNEMLKVDEVAERMRVNRRTVQSWIDNGLLTAVDVRPAGASKAMWRVLLQDLVEFSEARKAKSDP